MSHKQAKRQRVSAQKLTAEGRGYPWIEESDCLKGRPMCHDCAFRKDSKEMVRLVHGIKHPKADKDECPVIMVKTHEISKMLHEGSTPAPFYCHETNEGERIATDESGKFQYQIGEDGKPIGVPVCAGWLAMVERFKRVLEEDGEISPRRKPKLERELVA